MKLQFEPFWKEVLEEEFEKEYFMNLMGFVESEYQNFQIFPPKEQLFSAFELTPFNSVKVVILGQDPYHGPNQANGLCFSVADGVKLPPSLRNIFKELNSDLGVKIPTSGNLEKWAKQGVLLLNATLSVRAGKAGSHQKKGWEVLTDSVIRSLAERKENLVFILWGNYAQKKGDLIDASKHCIIQSAHPSPLSAYNGFWDSKPFSKTNSFLKKIGKPEIDWNLTYENEIDVLFSK